jgi:hypothetical protein
MSQAFHITHVVQVINSYNKKFLWEKSEKNHLVGLGVSVTTVKKQIVEVCLDLCVEMSTWDF